MEIKITKIPKTEQELLWIRCHEVTTEVSEIVRFVRAIRGTVTGRIEDTEYEIGITDILYIESVDDRTYIYTGNKVYASGSRLYEMENLLADRSFLRISKSCVVNLMKIRSIRPTMNGRFRAVLTNGEEVIISRKYVPELKEKLRGGISE